MGRVAELGPLGGVTPRAINITKTKGNVTITNWIAIAAIIIPIIHHWAFWLVNRPKPEATPKPVTKKDRFIRLFMGSRWVYLSSAIIIFGIVALLLQLLSDAPLTRFSVFFIACLTTVIIVQILLTVIVHMRRDLQHAKTMADIYAHSHFS